MDVRHLVKMANQIEQFFRGAAPDAESAVAGIEDHLRRFWDPRMRAALIRHCAQGGEGLGDLAGRAVARLAAVPERGTTAS